MVLLFLSEPVVVEQGNDDDCFALIASLLNNLGANIWSLITSGGRAEARLWLCKAISSIRSITPRQQRDIFVSLLKPKPLKTALAAQLMQMIFEKRPSKAGIILAKRSHMLEDFFKGKPRRILEWFSSFSTGDSDHRKGAKALSQFAFVNRDICWEELEWKGKHGQSPAMVATKPHYFLDLDVLRTMENFIENVPEFWSSNEFSETLMDGEILSVDTKFFVDFFVELMYKEHSREVWEMINEFLMDVSFSSLCQYLLITLEERDFCVFIEVMRKFLNPSSPYMDFCNSSYWLEVILSKCSDNTSIDQLLLLNAVVNQGRQILRLIHDEEVEEERGKIKELVLKVSSTLSCEKSFALILKECYKRKAIKLINLLGLLSWVIHWRLSEECQTPESWEALFNKNGITYRKTGKFSFLDHNKFSEESRSDSDDKTSTRFRRKKRGKRKRKRRRKFDHDDTFDFDNELLDFDASNNQLHLQSSAQSWSLCTDGHYNSWSSIDLPEHISKYCFSTWMKWVSDKWE